LTDKSCFDELGVRAHYEVPKETFYRLNALAVLMEKRGARTFATTLRALLDQVECILEE
jgi:hypothetical protein